MRNECTTKETRQTRSIALPVLPNAPHQKEKVAESRTGPWRAAALITLNLLMIAHIIQWRFMGETVSPIEPSESMFTLQRGAVNAGVIFFSLAILATLIFGRFVCGWGCHIVSLQDLCGWIMKKMGITPRPFRSRLLIFVPLLVALYMFVWPTVARYLSKPANEPLFPPFTNHLITTNFWETFPPVAVAIPFLFICGFMTVYFLGAKGFCTYACPYGGFFAVADKFAPGRIRVTDACNECGHCTAVCTSNVLVHAEVKKHGMVVDPGCMKCMDCISVCPNDALYFGFGRPSVGIGERIKRSYTLTWPEEAFGAAVFFLSFLAVWDVYQLVPMLMALGIATVTTFLSLRVWRIITAQNVQFLNYTLKLGGRVRSAGLIFLIFSVLWIGSNIHSGFIRYHERAGALSFQAVQIPDELALAQSDPSPWLGAADRQNASDGIRHFNTAARYGFFTNKESLPKRAWLEYLGGDTNRALDLLRSAADILTGEGRALSLYYRGALLNRLGRHSEGLVDLDESLAERPDLVLAREEKGEALWQLGRRDEAVASWRDAAENNPRLVLAHEQLAGAAMIAGDAAAAAAYEKQAHQFAPPDPRFHWMLGLRLQNIGMKELADKHFQEAATLDPRLRSLRNTTR